MNILSHFKAAIMKRSQIIVALISFENMMKRNTNNWSPPNSYQIRKSERGMAREAKMQSWRNGLVSTVIGMQTGRPEDLRSHIKGQAQALPLIPAWGGCAGQPV